MSDNKTNKRLSRTKYQGFMRKDFLFHAESGTCVQMSWVPNGYFMTAAWTEKSPELVVLDNFPFRKMAGDWAKIKILDKNKFPFIDSSKIPDRILDKIDEIIRLQEFYTSRKQFIMEAVAHLINQYEPVFPEDQQWNNTWEVDK